jgi:hypothetical protein
MNSADRPVASPTKTPGIRNLTYATGVEVY